MDFEIYCDESYPDLFASSNPRGRYLVIGSVWLQSSNRDIFKRELHDLRDRHHMGGEFKWQKVSPSKIDFYKDLVNWFWCHGQSIRFRCIAVDRHEIDLIKYHQNDQELGFYKFYYQMLHHFILDFNRYSIFCDYKSNRRRDRLHTLKQSLSKTNLSSEISNLQAIRSRESVLMQLSDVFTGAVAAKLNEKIEVPSSKRELVKSIEEHLGREIRHTRRDENKFNVFVINLQGGW